MRRKKVEIFLISFLVNSLLYRQFTTTSYTSVGHAMKGTSYEDGDIANFGQLYDSDNEEGDDSDDEGFLLHQYCRVLYSYWQFYDTIYNPISLVEKIDNLAISVNPQSYDHLPYDNFKKTHFFSTLGTAKKPKNIKAVLGGEGGGKNAAVAKKRYLTQILAYATLTELDIATRRRINP
jgi:hypothetical protein